MLLEVPKVPPTMPDSFDVTLTVSASANPVAPGRDPYADLVVEQLPRPKSIEGVSTSTFGMAGVTRYGPVPHTFTSPAGRFVAQVPKPLW